MKVNDTNPLRTPRHTMGYSSSGLMNISNTETNGGSGSISNVCKCRMWKVSLEQHTLLVKGYHCRPHCYQDADNVITKISRQYCFLTLSSLNLLRSLYHCPLCHYQVQETVWLSHTEQPEFAEEFVVFYHCPLCHYQDQETVWLSHTEQPEFAEEFVVFYHCPLCHYQDQETVWLSHTEQPEFAEEFVVLYHCPVSLPRSGDSMAFSHWATWICWRVCSTVPLSSVITKIRRQYGFLTLSNLNLLRSLYHCPVSLPRSGDSMAFSHWATWICWGVCTTVHCVITKIRGQRGILTFLSPWAT